MTDKIDWTQKPAPDCLVMVEVLTGSQYWVRKHTYDYREFDGPHIFDNEWIKKGCYEIHYPPETLSKLDELIETNKELLDALSHSNQVVFNLVTLWNGSHDDEKIELDSLYLKSGCTLAIDAALYRKLKGE
tara:strand:+ start:1214 stop:1606 length:393 start_codon:yes stop_codon:yes gene_type:complete